MPATARKPEEDQDQDLAVLAFLRLAAEAILAHPEAVPPDLYELCDDWADHLAETLSPPGTVPPDCARPVTCLRRKPRAPGTSGAEGTAAAARAGQPL